MGAKTLISRKVIGKFSIRLVPDMHPAEVEKLVQVYVETVHVASGRHKLIKMSIGHGGKPFIIEFIVHYLCNSNTLNI